MRASAGKMDQPLRSVAEMERRLLRLITLARLGTAKARAGAHSQRLKLQALIRSCNSYMPRLHVYLERLRDLGEPVCPRCVSRRFLRSEYRLQPGSASRFAPLHLSHKSCKACPWVRSTGFSRVVLPGLSLFIFRTSPVRRVHGFGVPASAG
jgi:hypothetical protein